ncbi:MAG: hypothetical protein QME96_14095, partial [Myxococcota bacterium]|nr:hypothetical protein [Myxococcota bacterium]
RSFSVFDASSASAVLRISGDAPFGPSTVTLRPAAGVDAVNSVLTVTRAAGDAPTVEPAYLLADAAERGLLVLSGFESFIDGGIPWPAAVRIDFPGVRVGSFAPPAGGSMTFSAAVSPASPAGHATVGIHGSGAGVAGRGRHVGVRAAVWPAARRAAVLSPFRIRAGDEIVAVAVADHPAFVGGGVIDDEWPPESGLDRASLPVVLGPSALSLWIRSRHDAPPGDRVVMLHAGRETIPAVLEVLPPEAPPVFVATTGHVPAGATQVVEFVGTGTAWSGETRAENPAGDPDIERLAILGASGTAATVRVGAAAALRWPGGHVVFLENGFRTIAAGLVWLGVPAPAPLVLSPAWLHAGAEARVTVSSTAPVLAGATARGVDGVDVVSVEDREAHKATLVLRATGSGRSQGVIEMTVDGAPVTLVIPVLPVPPALTPDRVALPRSPTVRRLDLLPEGLGAPADLIPFPSGNDLAAGRVAETPGGSVLADVLIGVGAVASEPRWLVLAGGSGAAAVRLEIAGAAPAALPAGESESVALEPSVPVVRLLPGASAWTAARATCDDPDATVMTLLGPDGAVALHAGTGAVPWPHVLPPSGTGAGGAFLVVEASAPTTCRLHHGSWWAAPGFDEMEARAGTSGSNDDPGMEERIVPPVPGAAVAFRARLESGFDIDRYAIDLAAPAAIEVLTGLGRAVPMRPETVLEVVGPAGAPVTADAWDAAAAGIPSVRTTERGTHRISVRPVTGTSGEYVVSIRSPVVINEIDLWSAAGPFVELAAPPGTTLGAYSVERRSASGTPVAE